MEGFGGVSVTILESSESLVVVPSSEDGLSLLSEGFLLDSTVTDDFVLDSEVDFDLDCSSPEIVVTLVLTSTGGVGILVVGTSSVLEVVPFRLSTKFCEGVALVSALGDRVVPSVDDSSVVVSMLFSPVSSVDVTSMDDSSVVFVLDSGVDFVLH